MTQIFNEKFGTFVLITGFHLAAVWMLVAGMNKPLLTPPTPLPTVMVEMLPSVQPVKQELPQPKPPEPKPQPKETPKPPLRKEAPKPPPKKEAPRTTTSEKALTAPKQESPPAQPTASVPPETSAPPAPAAPPAPPAPPAPTPTPVTPPRFNAAYLNNPAPAYPPILRRAGEEGRVVLRVFVTAEGTAGEVQVLRPSNSALFDEAALSAVRKWRFVPAKRGDTAVAEWVQVPIDFKLN